MARLEPLLRGARLRCPNCGERGVWRSRFELHDRCPSCGVRFEREDGYWVGAMTVSMALTEGLFGLVVGATLLTTWPDVPWTPLLVVGLVLNLTVPIVTYPWAKTVWVGLDHAFFPPDVVEQAEATVARVDEDGVPRPAPRLVRREGGPELDPSVARHHGPDPDRGA